MKFISLFAGIGGFDLGLERAGMECVGQVEIDKKCQAVLSKHWPKVKRMGDIRYVKGTEFGTVDLICGGFPCQPFSTAGKRKGEADDRYLWPEMVRVIAAIRPTWIIGENVAGIISMALDKVHSDLEGIGYQMQSFIIPACAVGAPHRRDRVWIVAWNSKSTAINKVREIQKRENTKPGGICGVICDTIGKPRRAPSEEGLDLEGNLLSETRWDENTVGTFASSKNVSNTTNNERTRNRKTRPGFGQFTNGNWWDIEPGVGRVANGIPHRMDRLKQLGNAVVPQVVEEIGKAIMQIEDARGKGEGTGSTSSNTQKLSF